MKFTGQAKSCCSICGSGDHCSYGAPFLPLDPTIPSGHFATTSTEGRNAAKTPVPSATAAELATETAQPTGTMTPLQKLEARVIRNPGECPGKVFSSLTMPSPLALEVPPTFLTNFLMSWSG